MDKIPSLVLSSTQAFVILIPLLERADPGQAAIAQSDFARFKLWTGSLGAQRTSDTRSLTYRLRDASRLRSHVISLLEDLQSSLEEAYSLLDSSRPARSVPQYDTLDLDLASLLGDTTLIPSDGLNYVDELSESLTQIREVIDCLLRLSVTLSDPVPHDQFRARIDAEETHSENYNISKVQEAFPNLDSAISKRLGKAMTQRQKHVKYRADEHHRLQEGMKSGVSKDARSHGSGMMGPSPGPQSLRDSGQNDPTTSIDSPKPSTTFNPLSRTADALDVRLPLLPKNHDGGPLLCPLCFMPIPKEIQHDWKKHVFEDLRAYICIWGDCISSEQAFQTQDDWIRHMTTQHWREWSCPFECTSAFDDCDSLESHLRSIHPGELTPERIGHVSVLSSRTKLNRAEGQCPMCQKVEIRSIYDYEAHVGHHLEQLSLFALQARNDLYWDDNDSANIDTKVHEEKHKGRHQQGHKITSNSAEVDIEKISPTQMHPNDTSSGSNPQIEASSDKEISTGLSRIRLDDQDRPSSQYANKETKPPGTQEARSTSPSAAGSRLDEGKDKEESIYGESQSSQSSRKDDQGPLRTVDAPRSLSTGSRNEVNLGKATGGGSSSRRPKYVQEKKWFCAWCYFGPLDWTYDSMCLECGRPRDQYCRVEYQTRKVRATGTASAVESVASSARGEVANEYGSGRINHHHR